MLVGLSESASPVLGLESLLVLGQLWEQVRCGVRNPLWYSGCCRFSSKLELDRGFFFKGDGNLFGEPKMEVIKCLLALDSASF